MRGTLSGIKFALRTFQMSLRYTKFKRGRTSGEGD